MGLSIAEFTLRRGSWDGAEKGKNGGGGKKKRRKTKEVARVRACGAI